MNLRVWLGVTLLCWGGGFGLGAEVSFSRQIRPILSENCFHCHGPDEAKREAGLRLDDEAGAKATRDGVTGVVPGDAKKSAIYLRMTSADVDEVMPPKKSHKTMSAGQMELVRQWIDEGAKWGGHWSYEPVVKPVLKLAAGENAVDHLLQKQLVAEGLAFSPAAGREVLLRRLALDLTGLPPSLEEQAKLLNSAVPYAEVVTHYLNLPGYGEHWARMWLDLARYADSSGYPSDQPREIWAFRDWVIRALNENMRFDQFTLEQLAGDLLPKPTDGQLVATAFHRNTMTQNEGGTSDEEFRNAAVIDRVNTTMAVWMGTSMACAQCHTHKYDPITLTEYFRFYALLNQSADADKKDESPLLELYAKGAKPRYAELQAVEKKLRAEMNAMKEEQLPGLAEWTKNAKAKDLPKPVAAALAVPAEKRNEGQQRTLREHYVAGSAPESKGLRERLAEVQKELAALKPSTVPIMKELQGKERRVTRVQLRGNWQALDAEVLPGTPAVFHPLQGSDRMALAQWLMDKRNPLTARVMMNRVWEQIFGVGIVRTSEEFGSQGELPSHPELLDWLAAEFMESGWDLKHMIRLLVTSRAYQQVSTVSAALAERDPENRLLARGPRFRPTGEMLRDQALALSGLLSGKMYGPGVRPMTPNMGLSTAFGRSNDWVTSKGEDAHRRSLYTEVRRNSPYASFMTFDATNREVCTLRRNRTNTPLQAFVTLNDPVFMEAAQALARRMMNQGGSSVREQLKWLLQLTLCRAGTEQEIEPLAALFETTVQELKGKPADATKLATDPLGPLPAGMDAVHAAAWSTVANVVLNLDELVMRR